MQTTNHTDKNDEGEGPRGANPPLALWRPLRVCGLGRDRSPDFATSVARLGARRLHECRKGLDVRRAPISSLGVLVPDAEVHLLAVDLDVSGRLDPDPDLPSANLADDDPDLVSDPDTLSRLPCQRQHSPVPPPNT